MKEDELTFVRRRAAEEIIRAEHSADARIADVHRRMAIAYANRDAELSNGMRLELVPNESSD